MKKLNLNNQISDDDEKLISLLKTSLGREPSEQFVESTMEKFLSLKISQKTVYKPLKTPLYIMLGIGLILLTPLFLTFGSEKFLPSSGIELENLVVNFSAQLDSWYALSIILLVLISMCAVWIEMGLVRFRIPFD